MPLSLAPILATSAQIEDGNLVVTGAGWMVRERSDTPAAVAALISVPRDRLGVPISVQIELLTRDGELVTIDPPDGPGPMVFDASFIPGGVEDPRVTIPVTVPVAMNLPPFPLPEASEYRWQFRLDGQTREEWALPFRTPPPVAG
jgi:hypothetical protein